MSGDMKPCIAIVDLCPFLKDEEEKLSNFDKFKHDEIVKIQLKWGHIKKSLMCLDFFLDLQI